MWEKAPFRARVSAKFALAAAGHSSKNGLLFDGRRGWAKPVHSYGQYCPVAKASEILADRWTPLILRELLGGSHHFNELERGLPGIPSSLLAQRLRRLE